MRSGAAALALWLLLPLAAAAAEPVTSLSAWTISGQQVMLRFTFPTTASRLLVHPGAPHPSTETVAHYVLGKTSVRQDGTDCAAVDQGYDLGRIDTLYVGPGLYGFEILFRCPPGNGALALHNDALFDLSQPHFGLATVRRGTAPAVSRLVTSQERILQVPAGGTPAPGGASAWLRLGGQHLLASLAHLCTFIGLFLLARGRREFTFLAGGLCGGYLVATVAAGAGGWVLQAAPAQAWEGFLVLLTAALLVARNSGRITEVELGLAIMTAVTAAATALLGHRDVALMLIGAGLFGVCTLNVWRAASDWPARWLLPALAVGLVDGFSLPSDFAPLHAMVSIDTSQIAAFNLGVILVALGLFAATLAVRWLLRRHANFRAPLSTDLLAAVLAGLGGYWMLAVLVD